MLHIDSLILGSRTRSTHWFVVFDKSYCVLLETLFYFLGVGWRKQWPIDAVLSFVSFRGFSVCNWIIFS